MHRISDTRQQIMDRGFQLLAQRGLNGFSYRDISEPLGVKNAAIHYHFPSKSDLLRALIEENHGILKKATAEFMAYGGPARPQLEGLFKFTLDQCACGRPVCLHGSLSVNYDELDEDIRQANDRFMDDTFQWLTKVLEVGREQGEFRFEGDASVKAVTILAAIQGTRQMARIHGTKLLEKVFGQLRTDLDIDD